MKRLRFSLTLLLLIVTLCATFFAWQRAVWIRVGIENKERQQLDQDDDGYKRPDLYPRGGRR